MTDPSAALTIPLADETATARLGRALAGRLRPGDMIALTGDLGAGKTALARAIVRTLTGNPDEEAPSPTFTLVQTYDAAAGFPVAHFDLYRLVHPDEVFDLAFDEAVAEGVALVEWPDRLGTLVPRDRLDLALEATGPTTRRATLTAHGAWRGRETGLDRDAAD